jgi:uncharacterized membrane protein YgaE (UPF0421/DUF939 family)
MKAIMYHTVKITAGVILSIVIARFLQLEFALSAGVITALSMLDSKKQSIQNGIKRVYTALIALTLGFLFFTLVGYNLFSLGLILLIYIPLVFFLDATVGLVVNLVLVTHLYTFSDITLGHLANELLLLFIGIIIALILNLHMPNLENEIRSRQLEMEAYMKMIMKKMALDLQNQCDIETKEYKLSELNEIIMAGKSKAYIYMNSYYFKQNNYYVEYFGMRKQQYYRLLNMHQYLDMIFVTKNEAVILSNFTNLVADSICACKNESHLLVELNRLREDFRVSELPKTREEFEQRARLFQYMYDLEELIMIKKRFIDKFGEIIYCSV